ncbi:helix-turn-helix domain-containing protein [Romboutsia timonensis]|jgi:transcriptional regulator with XRE-family HTH domain|uniref:helix-turn-helix domain-containing protein n=1 Tax=Romboutsia timonensis TaxID=1776391 RepID=UPI0020477DE9|nr:helix-turn-helix transcriptional regulator [Clostridium sp.]UVX98840.1 MAG: helix-turn-helix domain protein [Bacteriophage sp.]DAO12830.1 MAG TPA: helix-turn-helix domain protein [Caudoviricetes sp.]
MTMGEKIKTARKEKRLTQKGVAELLEVSVDTIKKYERGDRTPRPETLKQLEEILGVKLFELVENKVVLAEFKNTSARVSSIPKSWLNELGINEENRKIELSFDRDRIIIRKMEN